MSGPEVIDLFAGPGGWDEGARMIGLADVLGLENEPNACATAEAAGHARLNTDIAATAPHEVGEPDGEIASPPCPGFSAAGKGLGRKDFELLLQSIKRMAYGDDPSHVLDDVREVQHDKRSALTLEPLRWALDLEPEWIALEQVPTVLPLWEATAEVLRADGYSVWTGNMHAEQYGVPQTRKRAVLMASRVRTVRPPAPTHSRYYPRSPDKLDEGVQKWVSMAEALSCSTGGYLRSNYNHGGKLSTPGVRDLAAPAFTVTGKFDRNRWVPTAALEGEDAADIWWPYSRPSPTIVGSYHPEVVAAPGYRRPGDPPRQKTPGSVRVTVQEAGTLQSFRPAYPWHGTQSKQFQQVGNAIPPLLAAHILAALTGRDVAA